MSKPFTYCYLDYLPKIPVDLLQDFEQYKQNQKLFDWTNKTTQVNGQTVKTSGYQRFQTTGKLREWLEFNIVKDAVDYGASWDNEACDTLNHYPHVDWTRSYSLNYIMSTGGNNVLTKFYHEEGQPIIRNEGQPLITRYDNLTEIDSVQVDTCRWVLLNTKVIHSVMNLTSLRQSMQVSLGAQNKFIDG